MIVLAGAKGDVSEIAISADGRVLAASGGGRKLELWNAASAKKWGRYERGMQFWDGPIAFHPTESVCFASSGYGVAEIETDTKKGRMLSIADKGITRFGATALTPDGAALVCHCNSDYFLEGELYRLQWKRGEQLHPLWRVKLATRTQQPNLAPRPAVVRVNPDGETFLTLDGTYTYNAWPRNNWSPNHALARITIRSMENGKVLRNADLPTGTLPVAVFAPDGRSFVTCRGSAMSIWNADDLKAKPQVVKSDTRSRLTAVAFHPSGKFLAVASNDKTVKLYDTANWKSVKTFTWDIGKMRSVCFSPDGTLAAAGSDAGKVVVWDVDV